MSRSHELKDGSSVGQSSLGQQRCTNGEALLWPAILQSKAREAQTGGTNPSTLLRARKATE
jgi:hypothetical protein